MPTSNASNKSNEDYFFREGTRVIFVWFGALRMAFFIVSPVKQTVAIATFASQISIKKKKKKKPRKERPIPEDSNYNVSLPDDNLESADSIFFQTTSFAHVTPNSSTQFVLKYIKVHTVARWTIRHGLMLLWFADLINLFLSHTRARGPWERADLSIHIATHKK